MTSLPTWLEAHKENLIRSAVQQLSSREELQRSTEDLIRTFFDSLIQVFSQSEPESLHTLLRRWVAVRTACMGGESPSVLPVLAALKRVLWQQLQTEPPIDTTIRMMVESERVLGEAAEFLAKIEAAALIDEIEHRIVAQMQVDDALPEKSKLDFVSVTAHELKTPLTVIEGYTNMLKSDLSTATDHPRAVLMIRGIENGVRRLRDLVEDMINVSLLDLDLLKLQMQPVWLHRLLDIAVNEINEAVSQRNLTLEVMRDTIPTRPTTGDPERLLQAIQKILTNAVKYTPDGGQVTIFGREINGFVDLSIEDNGIGIASENLERIFEKFFAVGDVSRHSSGKTKFKGGGPGFGLVIAKGIIEGHGGTVWAESPGFDEKKCPGSRFHIMIPMCDVKVSDGLALLTGETGDSLPAVASRPEDKTEKVPETVTFRKSTARTVEEPVREAEGTLAAGSLAESKPEVSSPVPAGQE